MQLVYVTRNPRDACLSFLNHWRVLEGFDGTQELFIDAFLNDVCGYYTPFIQHVTDYWDVRHGANVLFLTYEEMKRDLASVLRKTSAFLGRPVAEERIPALVDHLSFDKMKKNDAVNKSDMVQVSNEICGAKVERTAFMRQGKAGTWRASFTPEMTARFEEWENRWLKDSDFKFTYDG